MNFIPRLEWNDQTITGDTTSGSNVITSVVSTADVKEDMTVDHASFPAGTKVVSFTVNSITTDQDAVSSLTGVAIPLLFRLDFDYPSTVQGEPTYRPNNTVSESQGGVRQVQTDSIIKLVALEFNFVSTAIMNVYRDKFYLDWAVFGYEFRYFESKDETTSEVMELDVLEFNPQRTVPRPRDGGAFLYKVPMTLRRIYL